MNTTKSNCRECCRSTKHEILFEISHGATEDYYNEKHTWQVLRCRGCETVGFRYRFDDFDQVEEDFDGETRHKTQWTRYPPAITGHPPLSTLWVVPKVIRGIYRQTIAAYAGGSTILAGMGFRATIEAVCNYLDISGTTLEKRIDQLAKAGHISNADKGRLHAIRFLGNDAAHEIREPRAPELRVALDIIEHLINSVFILEYKAKNLDVPIETFEDFFKLLTECSRALDNPQPQSLASILGRSRRRIGALLSTFEDQLSEAIKSGKAAFLESVATEEVEGGKQLQLYRVLKDKLPEEDIPF